MCSRRSGPRGSGKRHAGGAPRFCFITSSLFNSVVKRYSLPVETQWSYLLSSRAPDHLLLACSETVHGWPLAFVCLLRLSVIEVLPGAGTPVIERETTNVFLELVSGAEGRTWNEGRCPSIAAGKRGNFPQLRGCPPPFPKCPSSLSPHLWLCYLSLQWQREEEHMP